MSDKILERDMALMRGVRQKDQRALAALYGYYGNTVYGLALHMIQDESLAEELTQDVFMRLWERANQWDFQKGRLSTWLLRITRNAAIDLMRKSERRPQIQDTPLEQFGVHWQEESLLRGMIARLPEEQQQVVNLAFFGGVTHRELAEMLELPAGTVKTRLRLGLQKLRRLWIRDE